MSEYVEHMSPAAQALNDGQRTFCHEYLLDFSPAQAYIRTYKPKSSRGAKASANRLMNKPEVGAYIQELVDRRNARTDVNADRVVLELARIGFSDVRSVMSWGESVDQALDRQENGDGYIEGVRWFPSDTISDDAAAAIAEVKETETTTEYENRHGETRQVTTRNRSMKFHPKMAALNKLSDHVGVGKEAHQPGGMEVNVTVNGVTHEEQQKELAAMFEEIDNQREHLEIDEDGEMVEVSDPSGKKE